ncbi:MAG: calcium/sodium antiporter [Pseudomonadota bacterium]
MQDGLLVFGGLIALIIGGDIIVRGAVSLAARLGIPALIISLTVVAFGTSAPELLIGIQSALEDVPELAIGNVVGSNVANVLLILGVPAILTGLQAQTSGGSRNFLLMMFATFAFIAIAFTQPFGVWQGILLLVLLIGILTTSFIKAQNDTQLREEIEEEAEDEGLPTWKMIAFLVGGIILLPVGADLLVDGATDIAEDFGVPDAIIGLTLVALGTSLPELATTVAAGFRKQGDVALGNVLGSNMFNLLAIIGATALIAPVPVPKEFFHIDFWVMTASSLILLPFAKYRWKLNRVWGFIFVALYLAYVFFLLS